MEQSISTPLWKKLLVPGTLVVIFILLIWVVIRIQQSFQVQPNLEVAIPALSNTEEDSINLTGKTTNEATITINDKQAIVDKNGNFSYIYTLNPGENKVVIKAKKGSSEPTIVEKTVIREGKTAALSNSNTPRTTDALTLTTSGPAENIGIIGLIGLIFSTTIYLKSRKREIKESVSYKLFT